MIGILWTVAVILLVLWVLGLLFHIAGAAIHILLVLAIVAAIYSIIANGRRTAV